MCCIVDHLRGIFVIEIVCFFYKARYISFMCKALINDVGYLIIFGCIICICGSFANSSYTFNGFGLRMTFPAFIICFEGVFEDNIFPIILCVYYFVLDSYYKIF